MPAHVWMPLLRRRESEVNVRLVTADGQLVNAQAVPGTRLLEVAQEAGLPLEGTCEGQMACSTCHVIIAPDWFDRLTPPSDDEEDMLDLAAGVTSTSRLACQIELTDALDGLEARMPVLSHDMQIA